MLLAADNTWLHFEDRVAYIDACMLGVYCLNGKAVFIMIDQGNNVGYLDLFTDVHIFLFASLMLYMCLNAKMSRYYVTVVT